MPEAVPVRAHLLTGDPLREGVLDRSRTVAQPGDAAGGIGKGFVSPLYACQKLPAGSRDRAWRFGPTRYRAIVGEETEHADLEFGVLPALACPANALSSHLVAAMPGRQIEYSGAVSRPVSWGCPNSRYVRLTISPGASGRRGKDLSHSQAWECGSRPAAR